MDKKTKKLLQYKIRFNQEETKLDFHKAKQSLNSNEIMHLVKQRDSSCQLCGEENSDTLEARKILGTNTYDPFSYVLLCERCYNRIEKPNKIF